MRGASIRSRSDRGMSVPSTPAPAPPPPSPARARAAKSPGAKRDRSRSAAGERDMYMQLQERLRDLYTKAGAPDLYNWRFRPPPELRSPSPV